MCNYISKKGPTPYTERDRQWIVCKPFRASFMNGKGILICRTCKTLISRNPRLRTRDPKVYGLPAAEERYFSPHLCVLSNLIEVEKNYRLGILGDQLFEVWMSINGKDYQLGTGAECMRLWKEVEDITDARSPLPDSWYSNLGAIPKFIKLLPCPRHKCFYVSVKWNEINNNKHAMDWFQRIWPYTSSADAVKTTVNAGNLIWHIRNKTGLTRAYDKWAPLFSVALPNVTITCMLIHLIANPEVEVMFDLWACHSMCCMDVETYREFTKAVSVAIRRTSKMPNGRTATMREVCSLAGWELSTGRSLNKSDWVEEKRKRTIEYVPLSLPTDGKQDRTTNERYLVRLRRVLREVMSPAVRPLKRKYSWRDHVENRQSWVSSGSTGGKRLKLETGEQIRLNKHSYFEQLTTSEMVAWLDSPPEIRATGSEKMEPGKKRAIYGSDPKDYSIHDYVIRTVEGSLNRIDGIESGLMGLDAIASMVRRIHQVKGPDMEGTMIDYTDFNYQHTLDAQVAVFSVLAELFEARGYHPDMIKACKWTAESFQHQYVRFPTLGPGYVEVTQGMFSGVRPTNFINTVLNLAYFRVAKDWVFTELGLSADGLYNLHQGDDVWISNKSRLWAIAVYQAMAASGLQFQGSKQMFDKGRGEFLRVMYTREGCLGYPARAVASLVVKPIQNTEIVSPAERATALDEHIKVLRRRGFSEEGCEVLWSAIVPYAAKSKLREMRANIPIPILIKAKGDGGLGLSVPGRAPMSSEQVARIPKMELRSVVLERSIPDLMARDWLRVLSKSYCKAFKSEAVVSALHRANVCDSLSATDRTQALMAHMKELGRWLAKVKPGPVQCTTAEYNRLLEGSDAGEQVNARLRTICSGALPKLDQGKRVMSEVINTCISSSPFKSVEMTRVATGLNDLAAAKLAVGLSPNQSQRDVALRFMDSVEVACGPGVLRAVIEGLRANASVFLGEVHPVVLYWIHDLAVDQAISEAVSQKERDVTRVRSLVERRFLEHLRSARKQPELMEISRY